MQLLDSTQTQQQNSASSKLLDTLQDIVTNVQIRSDFCIRHPDYKPLEPLTEAVARFRHLPSELQNKYLSLQLCSFLYGIYYNGSLKTALALETDSSDLAVHQDLENTTYLGVDLAFYAQVHQSNSGTGYFNPGWSVVRQESDGTLAVTKGGLTLHIEREQHLQLGEQSAVVGDSVALRMPKNVVQNGFYMAVGNLGSVQRGSSETEPLLVRVYCHLTPQGAIAVMGSLTRQLNKLAIPFSFKVLYDPNLYKRFDSGVLYFDKRHYEAVRLVLKTVYAEQRSHFQPEIPLFTKQLAPGLGLAEEPDRKFATEESFGMNRCQIVANGLLEALQTGDDSSAKRMNAVLQQFCILEIDWQRAYLNTNSEDIYTPLDYETI